MDNLFRGMTISSGEWVEGYYTFYPKGFSVSGKADHVIRDTQEYAAKVYSIDPETACQYTGKVDCNDVPIWEEDYVKINDDWIGRIVWQDKDTAFCVFPNDDIEHETYCLGYYIAEGYRVEVIGNIFDNPDLREA